MPSQGGASCQARRWIHQPGFAAMFSADIQRSSACLPCCPTSLQDCTQNSSQTT